MAVFAILASSASDLDGLGLELFALAGGGTVAIGQSATIVSKDGVDAGSLAGVVPNDSSADAYRFDNAQAIQNLFRVRGLSIDRGPDGSDEGDVDWFRFTLAEPGGEDDRISLVTDLVGINTLELELFDKNGTSLGKA